VLFRSGGAVLLGVVHPARFVVAHLFRADPAKSRKVAGLLLSSPSPVVLSGKRIPYSTVHGNIITRWRSATTHTRADRQRPNLDV